VTNVNRPIFQDFAEIAFPAGAKMSEMRNAIATIRKCENFTEMGLSCTVDEIHSGQSIEVSFVFLFFNFNNLTGQQHNEV